MTQSRSEWRCGEDGREYHSDPMFYCLAAIVVTVGGGTAGFGGVLLFGWGIVVVPVVVCLALFGTFAGLLSARVRGGNHV